MPSLVPSRRFFSAGTSVHFLYPRSRRSQKPKANQCGNATHVQLRTDQDRPKQSANQPIFAMTPPQQRKPKPTKHNENLPTRKCCRAQLRPPPPAAGHRLHHRPERRRRRKWGNAKGKCTVLADRNRKGGLCSNVCSRKGAGKCRRCMARRRSCNRLVGMRHCRF